MYYEIVDTTVRIMGGVHVFPPAVAQLPRWAADAANWADEYWFEMNNAEVGDTFRVPPERSCTTLLSNALLNEVASRWPTGQAFTPLESTPPWYVKLLIGMVGVNPAPGVEHHMLSVAQAGGKPVSYLESPAAVAAHLGAVPMEDIVTTLKESLSEFDNNVKNIKMLYADWSGRHLDALYRRTEKKTAFAVPSIHEHLLVNRNKAWLPQIEALLEADKRVLVVVGALHLCGPQNLLELLGREVALIPR
jgi:uncharacterized protein YbaP (TraB family)